jgi:predicted metalloprotease
VETGPCPHGRAVPRAKLVFYSREGESGCGEAQSAMGPFYCPSDMGIYLDTSFYDELAGKLSRRRRFRTRLRDRA